MTWKIDPKTRIEIQMGRHTYRGTVLHRGTNYGTTEQPNWYIEFLHDNGHYGYWKQKEDGGTLILI